MTDDPLFDFAVPEDLLREAVSHVKDTEVVSELEVMPGTGEGKPPALTSSPNCESSKSGRPDRTFPARRR